MREQQSTLVYTSESTPKSDTSTPHPYERLFQSVTNEASSPDATSPVPHDNGPSRDYSVLPRDDVAADHVGFPTVTDEQIAGYESTPTPEIIELLGAKIDQEIAAITNTQITDTNEYSSPVEASPSSPGRVATILRRVENWAGNKAEVAETDGVKAVLRRTGRAAVSAAADKQPKEISNNKISRFIDKIGINSDESRNNDGIMGSRFKNIVKAAWARKKERKIARQEKGFVSYDEAHEIIRQSDIMLKAAEIDADTNAIIAKNEADQKALDYYNQLHAHVDVDRNAAMAIAQAEAQSFMREPTKKSKKEAKVAKAAIKSAGTVMNTYGFPTTHKKASRLSLRRNK